MSPKTVRWIMPCIMSEICKGLLTYNDNRVYTYLESCLGHMISLVWLGSMFTHGWHWQYPYKFPLLRYAQ